MKKIINYVVIVLIIISNANLSAQINDYNKSNELRRESIQKYLAKDYQGFLKSTLQACKLRRNHPTLIYNTAIGYALTNKPDSAMLYLDKIADMRLFFPADRDSDFVSLWNNEKFIKISEKFKSYKEPVGNSEFVFSLPEKDLLTESVAFNPGTETFYVGSVHKRKIFSISKNGTVEIFTESGENDFGGVFGIMIDQKNNFLWACTGYLSQMSGFDENQAGISEVVKFDLVTKKILNKYRINNGNHLFGDLVVKQNGDVYVSDSRDNNIYLIKNGSDNIEPFLISDNFASLQGIDFSDDGNTLFAADYAMGLFKIDMNSKSVTRINIPDNCTDLGLDGLYFYKNSLIAIQNGVNPQRVIQLKMDTTFNNITSWDVIEANNEYFFEPTLGVLNEDEFYYIANSQWPSFKEDGSTAPDEELQNPVILKTKLK